MQVNLDFESEKDMIDKFRIGLALQPIAVALFANSPFKEGKPTGGPRPAGGRRCCWAGSCA
jgi:glutamate--cysteine ligase